MRSDLTSSGNAGKAGPIRHGIRRCGLGVAAVLLAVAGLGLPSSAAGADPSSTITATPTDIDFGIVHVGDQTDATMVTVTNTGSGQLTITAHVTNTAFNIVPGSCSNVDIGHGDTCTVGVKFVPNQAGQQDGQLVIDGSDESTTSVRIHGNATLLTATQSPPDVEGTVGQTSTAHVVITNLGSQPMTVTKLTTSGPFSAPTIASDCENLPGSKSSCSQPVQFKPTSVGPQTGALTITTDNAGTITVKLNGTGVEPPTSGTRYVQTSGSDESNDCTDQDSPCASIEHAVSVAASGDTIKVGAGDYRPDGLIEISKDVTIDGATGDSTPRLTVGFTGAAVLAVTNQAALSVNGLLIGSPVQVSDGSLTLTDATITQAFGGPALEVDAQGTAKIIDSTIDHSSDDAVDVSGGMVTIEDSTIADNAAGVDVSAGTATIVHSTIAGSGGNGVSVGSQGSAVVAGSIIANNTDGDCSGSVHDAGYNLDSDGTCGLGATSQPSVDPKLGQLTDNGGPTQTLTPASDSPAVDVIPADAAAQIDGKAVPLCTGVDQRGIARPHGAMCDVGSVEVLPPPPATTRYVSLGGTDESNDCTSSVNPCESPAHAMDRANSGDTIEMAWGTYFLDDTLEISKDLTIEGDDSGPTTIVNSRADTAFLIDDNVIAQLDRLSVIDRDGDQVGIGNYGDLTVTDSTIAGAGKWGVTSGSASGSSLVLANSTVTGYTDAGVRANEGSASIVHSTIADNAGVGVQNAGGTVNVAGSIVSGNDGGDCTGTITDASYNLASDQSCTFTDSTSKQATDPKLTGLTNHGGPNPTMDLEQSSPAIDVIPTGTQAKTGEALCSGTDERGLTRPQGATCDLGAVEWTAPPKPVTRYVSTSGKDAGTCTDQASPCATIDYAIGQARGGDTIEVGPGTFSPDGPLEPIANVTINGSQSGSTVIKSAGEGVYVNYYVSTTLNRLTITTGSDHTLIDNYGDVTITDSTLRDGYDALASGPGNATVADSTISATSDVGIYVGSGTTSIVHSTIAGNTGWGVQADGASVVMAGSIVANNEKDCDGTITDAGYNLDSDGTCGLNGTGDLSKTDPELGKLADHGGPSETLAPASDSPVVNAIPAGTTVQVGGTSTDLCTGTDQRGVSRPQEGNCDIGAVEFRQAPPATRYVAATGGTDTGDCTDVKQPCATITYAIEHAVGGDTIQLGAGTFDEAVTVDKDVSIQGAAAGSTISPDAQYPVTIDADATARLVDLTIVGSSSADVLVNGSVSVVGSTLTSPTGGVQADAGISVIDGDATVTDSTLAGLLTAVQIPAGSGSVAVVDSTITANTVGVFDAAITLAGSIVAGNDTDCQEVVTDAGYNLDGDGTCGFGKTSDLSKTDPELGQLADNGGAIKTFAPKSASPVVNAIPAGTTVQINGTSTDLCADTDQRGVSRPQGDDCDLGAVELAASGTALTASPKQVSVGQKLTLTATVTAGPALPTLPQPAGAVTFTSDGQPVSDCTGTALADGTASCIVPGLAAGEHTFAVSYTGTNGYLGSAATVSRTVDKIALTVSAPSPSMDRGDTTLPELDKVTYGGFTDGDGPGELGGTLSCGLTDSDGNPATLSSDLPPGKYTVTCGGQTSPKYAIRYQTGTLTVHPPLVIGTQSLPPGTVGSPYHAALKVSGGDGKYNWSITEGALPDGLTLHGKTGVIDGTPTAAGTADFTVTVNDPVSASLSITIKAAPVTPPASTPPPGTGSGSGGPSSGGGSSPGSTGGVAGTSSTPTGSSSPSLAHTGTDSQWPLLGGIALLLGGLLLLALGVTRRISTSRHRG